MKPSMWNDPSAFSFSPVVEKTADPEFSYVSSTFLDADFRATGRTPERALAFLFRQMADYLLEEYPASDAPDPMALTLHQEHIVYHASGLSRSETLYRSHYCDSADDADLLDLVKRGYMTGPQASSLLAGSMAYFYLTDRGKELAKRIKAREKK